MPRNTNQVNQSGNTTQEPATSSHSDNHQPGGSGRGRPPPIPSHFDRRPITRPGHNETQPGVSSPADYDETASVSSHYSEIPLDSDEDVDFKGISRRGSWEFVDAIFPSFRSAGTVEGRPAEESSVQESSQNDNSANASSHGDVDTPSSQDTFRFDDENAEYIASDSDLDWDKQPFDYEIPFERPMLEERYSFEMVQLKGGPPKPKDDRRHE